MVWYNYRDPGSSAIMREERSRLREGNPAFQLKYEWVPYDKISRNLKRAVVASEDSRFTEHDGIEWDAIRKAWEYNQRQEEAGRSKMRGGSTITQQLAKNLFLSSSRSYIRKGQELVLTYMIEHVMTKERILELYLNVAEWGVGVFGAQAAAQHYFNTSAANLSASQSARLAAMLPNPRFYDARRNSNYLNSRVGVLTRRMRMVDIP
ncbi:Penicillin-binding protein 1F [compost metagenome]